MVQTPILLFILFFSGERITVELRNEAYVTGKVRFLFIKAKPYYFQDRKIRSMKRVLIWINRFCRLRKMRTSSGIGYFQKYSLTIGYTLGIIRVRGYVPRDQLCQFRIIGFWLYEGAEGIS